MSWLGFTDLLQKLIRAVRYLIVTFVILILGAALSIFTFAFLNDFNSETLDVVFKALGGVAVAVFFLAKGIWVDAPAVQSTLVPAAFLHNIKTGQLRSFSRPHLSQSAEEMDKFKGINEIDTISIYEKFKELNLDQKLAIGNTNEIGKTYSILLDELEFIFFQWLAQEIEVGWGISTEKVFTLNGFGGGGISNVPEMWVLQTQIRDDGPSPNQFLKKFEISLRVPRGTIIKRTSLENIRKIELKSPNLSLKVEISPRGGGVFTPELPNSAPIAARLGITSKDWWEHYFVFKFEYQTYSFSRFSNRSKAEQEWIVRLLAGFEKSFSWDLFRKNLK